LYMAALGAGMSAAARSLFSIPAFKRAIFGF
jgi:hypothetical protein